MDAIFKALADPARRRILDRLFEQDGQALSELGMHEDMSRQAVTKHLDILKHAGLVTSAKLGRERKYFLNPVPIQDIADRWISKFDRPKLRALNTLKQKLENTDD